MSTDSKNEAKEIKGCEHYNRGCEILSPCCNKFYSCRFCHDDAEDHQLNRYEIKTMKCLDCREIQPVQKECRKCKGIMGNYYCDICHLFENEKKAIYHCDKCKICRVGENNTHCDTCGVCVVDAARHGCIKDIALQNCVLCQYPLLYMQDMASTLECDHSLHTKCLIEYIHKSEYPIKCPQCRKSVVRDTEKKLDGLA